MPKVRKFDLAVALSAIHYPRIFIGYDELRDFLKYMSGGKLDFSKYDPRKVHEVMMDLRAQYAPVVARQHPRLSREPMRLIENPQDLERWLAQLKKKYGDKLPIKPPK